MSTPLKYTYCLSPEAYALPILHAARHLSSSLLGLFLSPVELDPSSPPTTISITTALPLIHHYTSLSCMAELGMQLAAGYAEDRGLRIVGVYVAHEGSDKGLGRAGERILAALHAEFEGAFAMLVSLYITSPRSKQDV